MLAHFVRAKTLVFIVLLALFIGLAWFSTDYDTQGGRTGPACKIKVYGRCYRDIEVRRLVGYFEVARQLLMVDFALSLFGENRLDRDPTDFVTNLIVLHHEAERLGIEPSDEEAKEAIRTAPVFGMQTWIDDDLLVNSVLAPRGLTKADLIQLGKDYLCWRKLGDLLQTGNEVVPIEVEKAYIREYQTYTASLAEFPIDSFKAKATVTPAEIEKYHAENQSKLLSEEKRGFSLVKFAPPAETEGMTNEQKARQKLDFNNRVNEIYATLANDESKFTERARALTADASSPGTITVEEIAPFAESSPPEFLQKDAEGILGDLFSQARSLDAGRSITIPHPRPDGGFFMFKISQVVKPVELTLDEAKKQIETVLINQKADQLVNEAATVARTKMIEALRAGKSPADAAKEAGVTLKPVPPFSQAEPPAEIDAPREIVRSALETTKGSAGSILPMPFGKGYRFLVVEKIELVESDQAASRRDSIRIGANSDYRRALFQAWFRKRLAESGVQHSGPVIPQDEEQPGPEAPRDAIPGAES